MTRPEAGLPGLGVFLVQELVPSAHRWRAAFRLGVTATLALAAVLATHAPQGEYLIVLLFLVGQNDVWASPRRAWLRLIWLAMGSLFVVWTLAAFADKPWIRFPLQSIVLGGCIFLGRTSTAPFAVTMFALCFLLGIPEYVGAPQQDLELALWRLLMVTLGVLLGTLVQLWVWRERPQDLLRLDLARRLRHTEALLGAGDAGDAGGRERPGLIAATGLTGQLDLLDAAEQESPWLRRRHAVQLKVITTVQVIVRGALRFRSELEGSGGTSALSPFQASRLAAIRQAIRDLAAALEQGRPEAAVPLQPPPPAPGSPVAELGPRMALGEMEHALIALPPLLAFLHTPDPVAGAEPEVRPPFLTAAFRLDNAVDLQVALKAALSISVCGLLYQALSWPGLAACVFATIVLAQGSVGASFERSLVQILCVLVGAGWALLVVTAAMPSMTSLASLLVVTFPFFFAVAWVCSGPGVSTTAGVQMAMAGSLVVLAGLGPTTDLVPARDRVLGILLGNVVFALINLSLWPVFAGSAARLRSIVQQIAALLGPSASADPAAQDSEVPTIYRGLARELALQDEARFEPLTWARNSSALLQAMLIASARLQDVFLEVLELRRLHAEGLVARLREEVRHSLMAVESAAAERLQSLVRSLEGAPIAPASGLASALQTLEARVTHDPAAAGSGPAWVPAATVLSATRLLAAVGAFEQATRAHAAIEGGDRSASPPADAGARNVDQTQV